MKTECYYFTFGQSHRHERNGHIFDKDCLVKIRGSEFLARNIMFNLFGGLWENQYSPTAYKMLLSNHPRGVVLEIDKLGNEIYHTNKEDQDA